MFFILHANVCGNSLPHHGHSHGGHHGHSHGNHHEHSHDEAHEHTTINADSTDVEIAGASNGEPTDEARPSAGNINVRAAMIHVIGDFVQSVGVLCAAILIKFKVNPIITNTIPVLCCTILARI